MAKIFNLEIIAPGKLIYKGEVVSLVVPAELGYLGVLADHAPLIANIVRGKITLRDTSENRMTFDTKTRGFLQVLKNDVTLILEDATQGKGSLIEPFQN
jgi:F-type H+-transporting ATPase subunit epsilon